MYRGALLSPGALPRLTLLRNALDRERGVKVLRSGAHAGWSLRVHDFPTSNSVHKTNNMASRLEDPVLKSRFKEGWGALTPDVVEVPRYEPLCCYRKKGGNSCMTIFDQTLLAAAQANSSRKDWIHSRSWSSTLLSPCSLPELWSTIFTCGDSCKIKYWFQLLLFFISWEYI